MRHLRYGAVMVKERVQSRLACLPWRATRRSSSRTAPKLSSGAYADSPPLKHARRALERESPAEAAERNCTVTRIRQYSKVDPVVHADAGFEWMQVPVETHHCRDVRVRVLPFEIGTDEQSR